MKKLLMIFVTTAFVSPVFAQDTTSTTSESPSSRGSQMMEQGKATAQNVMAACKDEKVRYCEKYNEMEALKSCLSKNKENLSAGCKSSLHL